MSSPLTSARAVHPAWLPWAIPFGIYMGFLVIESGVEPVASWAGLDDPSTARLWLYPVKIGAVVCALRYFWSHLGELHARPRLTTGDAALAVPVGIGVYLAWVQMTWPWAVQGEIGGGYNPFLAGSAAGTVLAVIRLVGAAVVVPIMEELFWRSFLLRYLIASDFSRVRLGAFTPVSFAVAAILFGVEHQLWLAGIVAGAAYSAVLYRTGRLWPCIVAHAVTNGLLAAHVLVTGDWSWW